MKKYNAWKAKSNGDYIDGTDRLLSGKSKRSILSHLSYEEGVEYKHDIMIVRCKDGTIWCFQEV